MPIYNAVRRGHPAEAVVSVLGQIHTLVRCRLVDDCSDHGIADAITSLAAGDPRVAVECNARRMGLVRNWRFTFPRLAAAIAPPAAGAGDGQPRGYQGSHV